MVYSLSDQYRLGRFVRVYAQTSVPVSYTHLDVYKRQVYISMPTEFGMVYTREELTALYTTCQKYNLRLFIDGARLGYGLVSEACDYDLPYLAKHCDVFYIGGTKVGAMMGEAVVFSGMKAPKYFFTNIKRHGALLAKGRMLGLSLIHIYLRRASLIRFSVPSS